MKKGMFLWQVVGFIFVSIMGIILHFLLDWTNIGFTSFFSAVNESTWEHMKIIFFPMLLFSIIEYLFAEEKHPGFWCIKLRGILVGLVLIPTLFYTLEGIFGTTPDWLNIAIFFVSLAAAYIYEIKQLKKESVRCISNITAIAVLCLIVVLFAVFTYYPPHIPLFQNPIDGSFGI